MWSPVARVYVAYWVILSVESRTNLEVYPKGHAREGRVIKSRKSGCKARKAACLGDVGDRGAGSLPSPPSLHVHIVCLNVRKIRQVVVFARSTFLSPPPPPPPKKKNKRNRKGRRGREGWKHPIWAIYFNTLDHYQTFPLRVSRARTRAWKSPSAWIRNP